MVLFICTDGLRPDALEKAHTPAFDYLLANGAYTLQAKSIMPTSTLPCHMSIFHSVPPERHNVLTNHFTPMVRPLPGLIETLFQQGRTSASYYTWEPLRDLWRPLHISYSFFQAYANNPEVSDDRVVKAALPVLKGQDFDFNFLHLDSVDEVGHIHGWMSEGYLKQVEHIDKLIGEILEVLPSDCTILVHSDHGGHDRMHGTNRDEDMLIPWMMVGPQIKKGYELTQNVTLLDTAPTIAKVLDIKIPQLWEGTVIEEAFTKQQ